MSYPEPNKHILAIAKLETCLHFLSVNPIFMKWNMVGFAYALFAGMLGFVYEVDFLIMLFHYGMGAVIGISIGLMAIPFANKRMLRKIDIETN